MLTLPFFLPVQVDVIFYHTCFAFLLGVTKLKLLKLKHVGIYSTGKKSLDHLVFQAYLLAPQQKLSIINYWNF